MTPPWRGLRRRRVRLATPDGYAHVELETDGGPSPATIAALEDLVRCGALAVRGRRLVPAAGARRTGS